MLTFANGCEATVARTARPMRGQRRCIVARD